MKSVKIRKSLLSPCCRDMHGRRKTKFFTPINHKPRTTAVIDHDIITRRADEELLKCVGVEQMEASSTVAGSSSRAARPCAADAIPPRYPQVR